MIYRRVLALGLALAALLASCAPPPRPGELRSFAARYREGRSERVRRLTAADAQLVLRVDGRATGRLPGMLVSAAIAGPDRLRLRAGSLLGTAFDLVAEADSVRAWVPSRHALLEVGGLGNELGLEQPVALLLEALTGTWDPPAVAWRDARRESTWVRLEWQEGADDWAMTLDAAAHPLFVSVTRSDRALRVSYGDWHRLAGADWPQRVEIADADGWLRLRSELQSLRTPRRPREDRFTLRVPDDAERLDWAAVRARLVPPVEDSR